MQYQLKSKEHYESNKAKFNKSFNFITKKYLGRPRVGSCSTLYEQLRPSSYQDFMDKYLESGKESGFDRHEMKGREDKGRTMEELEIIAHAYHDDLRRYGISYEECLDDLINHIILETFDGHDIERHLIRLLERNKGYVICGADGDLDAEMGVDIVIRNASDKHVSHFMQVKPISTFMGNSNQSLKADRVNFYKKQEKLDSFMIGRGMEPLPIEYIIYDRTTHMKNGEKLFLRNPKGGFRHLLSDLCDIDGTSKLKYTDLSWSEIK